jgi:tripartite ATP-independent transporter DctM subunit
MAAVVLAVIAILLFLAGEPIGFSLSIGTLAAQAANGDSLLLVPQRLFNGADSFPLVAIPLFIMTGQLMNGSGISQRLIAFAASIVGFMRGGLAHANVVVNMIMAEMSGSAVADAAALGTIMIPAMRSKGYPANFAVSLNSSAASIAIIIPPSIPMILYAVTAETSVTQLFIAGVIPGIILGLAFMAFTYVLARRRKWPIEQRFSLSEVRRTFVAALPSFLVPFAILGGIFSGIFTATESAGIALIVALLVGTFIHRELDMGTLPKLALDAAIQTAVVMLIVAASAHMGSFISNQRIPQDLAATLSSLTRNPLVILLILNIFLFFVGMVLHSAAAIVMVVPVVMPLVRAVGIDPIHFGIIVTLNMAIGQQTPPVASVLLTTCSIARISVADAMRVNVYFILIMVLVTLLVTYVPAVSLTLPSLIGAGR